MTPIWGVRVGKTCLILVCIVARPWKVAVTAADLIAALLTPDPSHLVVDAGGEGGFAEVGFVRTLGLRLNCNQHDLFGPHDFPLPGQPAQVTAVVLDANGQTL